MNKSILIGILILKYGLLLSQNTPLSIAQLVFSNKPPRNIKQYSAGEYKESKSRPTGKDFDKRVKKEFFVLEENEKTAVVNMTLTMEKEKSLDTYLHFVKEDNKWKIWAYRGLALTGLIEGALEEMNKMNPNTIDSMIQKGNIFKSREDFEFSKFNMELTLSSDKDLIKHFEKNKTNFEDLKNKIASNKDKIRADTTKKRAWRIDYGAYFENEMKKLGLRSANDMFGDCNECTDFIIGGMTDNTVGYCVLVKT